MTLKEIKQEILNVEIKRIELNNHLNLLKLDIIKRAKKSTNSIFRIIYREEKITKRRKERLMNFLEFQRAINCEVESSD